MKQYLDLARHVMANGVLKADRTGTGTKSVFGWQSRYNLQEGFPLLTTKKVFLRGIIHELLWFLNGDTNIKYLLDNNVHIWDEWADANGDLGPVYGYQWRHWPGNVSLDEVTGKHYQKPIDQISNLVQRIKNKPDDRRLIVTAWNPADVDKMALPPCHCFFQVYTRELSYDQRIALSDASWVCGTDMLYAAERGEQDAIDEVHEILDSAGIPRRALDLQLYQRSCDIFLGVPFNIASYALLTMMLAQVCNMVPGEFVHTYGDAHIYTNHFDQINLQLSREVRPLPKMKLNPAVKDIFSFKIDDFTLEGYDPHPVIKGDVAV